MLPVMKTIPISLEERREQRRASLPDAVSEQQLLRRSTARIRYALSELAVCNVENVQHWLDQVALFEGPGRALELYLKMIEYSVPKLSRAEVKVDDGDKANTAELTIDDLQQIIRDGINAAKLENKTTGD